MLRVYRRVITRLIAMLPESLGEHMMLALAKRAADEFHRAGSPRDWLFIVGGTKSYDDGQVTEVLDNLHRKKWLTVHYRQECFMLYEALLSYGVPASQILWENQSNNTEEQAVIYHGMLQRLSPGYTGGIDTTVVCHSKHERRAKMIFRDSGHYSVRKDAWTVEYFPDITNPSIPGCGFQKFIPEVYGLAETAVTARYLLRRRSRQRRQRP